MSLYTDFMDMLRRLISCLIIIIIIIIKEGNCPGGKLSGGIMSEGNVLHLPRRINEEEVECEDDSWMSFSEAVGRGNRLVSLWWITS